jgi:hypothetical protein
VKNPDGVKGRKAIDRVWLLTSPDYSADCKKSKCY